MSCADCRHRQKTMCMVFDDIILSFADTCFMDTNKDDFSIIENNGDGDVE